MNNLWQGKKWFCYGTSMTDNVSKTPSGNNSGHYSKYLVEFSGLEEHNFGKGGSGIVPALYGEDNVKSRIMRLSDGKEQADLITVEIIPNDFGRSKLGTITDLTDQTFLGNLNQVLEYLLTNTEAVIVVLIATRPRYNYKDIQEKYPPTSNHNLEIIEWEEAVEKVCKMHGVPCWNGASEANLGYYRLDKDNTKIQDQIHLTEEGGKILAKYYWGKLQNLYPIK